MMIFCPVVLGIVHVLPGFHIVLSIALGAADLLGDLRLLGIQRERQADDLPLEKAQAGREVEFKQLG